MDSLLLGVICLPILALLFAVCVALLSIPFGLLFALAMYLWPTRRKPTRVDYSDGT